MDPLVDVRTIKKLAVIEFSDWHLMNVKRLDERRVAYMDPKRV